MLLDVLHGGWRGGKRLEVAIGICGVYFNLEMESMFDVVTVKWSFIEVNFRRGDFGGKFE